MSYKTLSPHNHGILTAFITCTVFAALAIVDGFAFD